MNYADHPGVIKPACNRRLLVPDARVWWALWRCSRDKWLSPDQVYALGVRFASCLSSKPESILLRTIQGSSLVYESCNVGMLRGYPPFQVWESGYEEFRKHLRTLGRPKGEPAEMKILKLRLKDAAHGR